MNRPKTKNGNFVADHSTANMVDLFGGSFVDGVSFSRDQQRELFRMYKVTPPSPEQPNLFQEGAWRNCTRYARTDGYRLVAFLARYCEEGEDPLSVVKRAMADAGYDVELTDYDLGDEVEEDE